MSRQQAFRVQESETVKNTATGVCFCFFHFTLHIVKNRFEYCIRPKDWPVGLFRSRAHTSLKELHTFQLAVSVTSLQTTLPAILTLLWLRIDMLFVVDYKHVGASCWYLCTSHCTMSFCRKTINDISMQKTFNGWRCLIFSSGACIFHYAYTVGNRYILAPVILKVISLHHLFVYMEYMVEGSIIHPPHY